MQLAALLCVGIMCVRGAEWLVHTGERSTGFVKSLKFDYVRQIRLGFEWYLRFQVLREDLVFGYQNRFSCERKVAGRLAYPSLPRCLSGAGLEDLRCFVEKEYGEREVANIVVGWDYKIIKSLCILENLNVLPRNLEVSLNSR